MHSNSQSIEHANYNPMNAVVVSPQTTPGQMYIILSIYVLYLYWLRVLLRNQYK